MKILLNKKIYILLIIIGIIGIMDTLALLTVSKANLGIIFPSIFGCMLIIVSLFKIKGIVIIKRKNIRLIILLIFILWIASFTIIEMIIIVNGNEDSIKHTDYVILLGAGVKDAKPTLTLYKRLEMCRSYLEGNTKAKVIVSGGLDYGEEYTEAEVMKKYLIDNGIEEERIIKEEKSTSTMENFLYSKKILEYSSNEVIIITNDFHMYRSKMLARRNGFIPYGIPTETPSSVKVNCYIREYFAFIKSYFFDK